MIHSITRREFMKAMMVGGAAVGSAGLLAACSGSTGSSSSSSSTGSGSSEGTSSDGLGGVAGRNQTMEQTWADGTVLTWMILDNSSNVLNGGTSVYENLIAIDRMEEDLNVKIEFQIVTVDDDVTTMLTSGTLPDLMSYKWNNYYSENGGVVGLYADGICVEMSDLVEMMPNMSYILEEYPQIEKDLKTDDGLILYMATVNPGEELEDYAEGANTGMIIRQDWLDNLGLEVPTTIDEWHEMLIAFKNMDPNGNGLQDEIPFDGSNGLGNFAAAFGFVLDDFFIDPDTGAVDYGYHSQRYRSFLETMNQWYSEGLLGDGWDDTGTWIGVSYKQNIVADLCGSWRGKANNEGNYLSSLQEKNPAAEFVPVNAPIYEGNGKVYTVYNDVYWTVWETQTLISTDCKNLDAAAAVLDWCYSEKGTELLTWGEEGVSYTLNEDGSKSLIYYQTDEDGNTTDTIVDADDDSVTKTTIYKKYGNYGGYLPYYGAPNINLYTRSEWYQLACWTWADVSFDLIYPSAINLSVEDSAAVSASNYASLYDYIDEMYWKFITGKEPISNFDTYITEIERMGMNDIIAVYQAAYDSYLER